MDKFRVEFLPAADNDLENIFDYIWLDNPQAAENMLEKIISSLRRLETSPNSGTKITLDILAHYHFRMIIIKPHIAFYKVFDDVIYVYRILHDAQDYIHLLNPYVE